MLYKNNLYGFLIGIWYPQNFKKVISFVGNVLIGTLKLVDSAVALRGITTQPHNVKN